MLTHDANYKTAAALRERRIERGRHASELPPELLATAPIGVVLELITLGLHFLANNTYQIGPPLRVIERHRPEINHVPREVLRRAGVYFLATDVRKDPLRVPSIL